MLDELRFVLSDPHARHAAIVHLPIMLTIIAMLISIALACTGFRHRLLAGIAIVSLVVASAGAGLAADAGEEAEERIEERLTLSHDEEEAIERHESLGEGGWMWPLGAAALLALVFVPRDRVRVAGGGAGVAAAVAVTVWAMWTAHTGGMIVYQHGLGVPERGAIVSAWPDPAGAPSEDHDHEEDDDDDH